MLPKNKIKFVGGMGVSSGGRGELGLDSAEPGLRLRKLSESGAQVGVAVLMLHDMICSARKRGVSPYRPVELFRRGSPTL